jgi:ElaB/YqjD/DUF883 family membrane-anchored ribosome-binding protein
MELGMATESTSAASRSQGARVQSAERESAVERDTENLGQQIEALKSDLAAISATLADLVKDSAREGRATIEKTADHYVREARRQADTAVEGARAYGEALEGQITRNPFSAVLVALGLGFLVGLMSRR